MPSHVRIFFWLAVAALAWTTASVVWDTVFPSAQYVVLLAKLPPDLREKAWRSSLELVLISTFVWLAIKGSLIWLTAYRRQNWARWTYGIIAGLQTLAPFITGAIFHRLGRSATEYFSYRWQHPLSWLETLAVIAAIAFVFTGNADAWFAKPKLAAA